MLIELKDKFSAVIHLVHEEADDKREVGNDWKIMAYFTSSKEEVLCFKTVNCCSGLTSSIKSLVYRQMALFEMILRSLRAKEDAQT